MFSLFQAARMVRRQKGVSLLTMACFALGCLLLFVALSYGEAFLDQVGSYDLQERGESLHVTIHTQREETRQELTSADLHSFLAEHEFVTAACLVTNVYHTDVTGERLYVQLIDEAFGDTNRYRLLEGRMFTPEELRQGADVCLIEEELQRRAGKRVGDTVDILGRPYQVVGVVRTMAFTGRMLLPAGLEGRFAEDVVGFDLVVRLDDMRRAEEISWRPFIRGNVKVLTGDAYYRESAGHLLSLFAIIFGVGVAVFLYALLNIYNIIAARMVARGRSIGIRMAVGAGPREIFTQFFLEIFLMMMAATVLIFAADLLIALAVRGTLNHRFGPITLGLMLANALLTSLLISWALVRRALRQSISGLMGGRMV